MPLLAFDRVTRRFARGTTSVAALDDVCLELAAGESVAVWGAAGSGKTTLLRVAAGIEAPDAGTVRFAGRDLSELSRRERTGLLQRQIGCVWQTVTVPRDQNVIEQVAQPLRDAGDVSGEAIEALALVGVEQLASASWSDLEDAERVRVQIARALVRRPALLLADEPTSRLNLVQREQLLGMLDTIADRRRIAVLMTAPDAPDTLRSQRVASLARGQLIEPDRSDGGTVIELPHY